MNFSASNTPQYLEVLSKPLDFRNMTAKYMRPGLDNYNRLYYPMAERPFYTFMRYSPIHLLWFVMNSGLWMNGVWSKMTRRSRYYLHMFGMKRRNTKNIDYRVRFNQRRRPVRRKRNLIAKMLMAYTNRALLFAFFIPWQWAVALAFFLQYFHRNTRRRRERRIKQRLLFAPRRYVFGEQWNVGSFFRLWRIPRRFFQKVYWSRRWKQPFSILTKRYVVIIGGLLFMTSFRPAFTNSNPTGQGAATRRGVPGNVRRFLRDYTHPYQQQDFHTPHAFQIIHPGMWTAYQERRLRYGQGVLTTMTEWRGHNVMHNYNSLYHGHGLPPM